MKALRIAIAAATGAARNESFPPYKSFVASAAASIATGRSEQLPGRIFTYQGPTPFHGAHDTASSVGTAIREACQSVRLMQAAIIGSHTSGRAVRLH